MSLARSMRAIAMLRQLTHMLTHILLLNPRLT